LKEHVIQTVSWTLVCFRIFTSRSFQVILSLGDGDYGGGVNVPDENDSEDEDDGGAVEGLPITSYVDLARTVGMCFIDCFDVILRTCIVRTWNVLSLAAEIQQPTFPMLIAHFLYDQLYPDNVLSASQVPLSACPSYTGKIRVHNSAVATFHAPCDPSGIGGMRREHIRAMPSWRKGSSRYDCVFLNRDAELPGMQGMDVVRVLLFFSFDFKGTTYPSALVRWFKVVGDSPDEDTGMWIVQPEIDADGFPVISIIHLECVIRAAHLLSVFGNTVIPRALHFSQSLDSFKSFYVNRFIDHHAFKTI
jgi:hypothetical protein